MAVKILFLTLTLSLTLYADPVQQFPQSQSPASGTLIRLPDGRLVPYDPDPAKRTICAEDCVEAEEQPKQRRVLSYTIIAGGVVTGIVLLRGNRPSRVPLTLPPAQGIPPATTPVPEPAALILLGSGLACLVTRLRKQK